eukprot:scaffold47414_cov29-Tisochrysis_lutea.AAC.8
MRILRTCDDGEARKMLNYSSHELSAPGILLPSPLSLPLPPAFCCSPPVPPVVIPCSSISGVRVLGSQVSFMSCGTCHVSCALLSRSHELEVATHPLSRSCDLLSGCAATSNSSRYTYTQPRLKLKQTGP